MIGNIVFDGLSGARRVGNSDLLGDAGNDTLAGSRLTANQRAEAQFGAGAKVYASVTSDVMPQAPAEVVVVTAKRPNPVLAAIRRGMDWLSAVADRSGDAIAEGIRRGNSFSTGAYYTNLAAQNYSIAQATGGMMRSSAQQVMAASARGQSNGPSLLSSPARALDIFGANAFSAAARGSMNTYARSNDPIERMFALRSANSNYQAAGLASMNTAIVDTGVQGAQTYAMGVAAEAGLGLVAGRVIGTRAAAAFAAERASSPSALARGFQGKGAYLGVDRFRDITLKEGTVIYAGEPGASGFFTTSGAFRRTGNDAQAVFEGLQVGARDGLYRPGLTEFVVTQDTRAAFGIVRQNSQFGPGGLPQIYIENFFSVTRSTVSYPLTNRAARLPE